MLTIYLTRHGMTEWNVIHRMQGWLNGELTEKGIKDGKALGERLLHTPIDRVYSSPSKRAYETAQYIIGKRNIELTTDDDLREIHFGEWDGRLRTEVEKEFPEEFASFWETPHLCERTSGESIGTMHDRVTRAFERIISENEQGTVLLVTHSIYLRVLLAHLKGLPISDVFKTTPPMNNSLTKIVITNGELQIVYENDTSHIKED